MLSAGNLICVGLRASGVPYLNRGEGKQILSGLSRASSTAKSAHTATTSSQRSSIRGTRSLTPPSQSRGAWKPFLEFSQSELARSFAPRPGGSSRP